MDFLIELVIYLVFAFGIWLFHWCMRHKNITLMFFSAVMMVVDVLVWLKVMGKL